MSCLSFMCRMSDWENPPNRKEPDTMDISTAITLIQGITYKPGWNISGHDNTKRFEGCIRVDFVYPATNSDRSEAPAYSTPIPPNGARASFAVIVSTLDDVQLYRAICQLIMTIEEHEMREFFRINPTYWAPFHPHKSDGITRWADNSDTPRHIQQYRDMTFGLA